MVFFLLLQDISFAKSLMEYTQVQSVVEKFYSETPKTMKSRNLPLCNVIALQKKVNLA